MLAIDADSFKSINDRFGHLAGDRALIEMVTTMRNVLPQNASIGRLGGEDFGVLIPDCRPDNARGVAELTCNAIATSDVRWTDTQIPLSISIGCACFNGEGYASIEDWLGDADRALYAAKASGGNRTCMADGVGRAG